VSRISIEHPSGRASRRRRSASAASSASTETSTLSIVGASLGVPEAWVFPRADVLVDDHADPRLAEPAVHLVEVGAGDRCSQMRHAVTVAAARP